MASITQSDLDTLRAHIGSGVQSVRYADGRQVTYQSLDDMLKAERRLLSLLAGDSARSRRRSPVYRNGL